MARDRRGDHSGIHCIGIDDLNVARRVRISQKNPIWQIRDLDTSGETERVIEKVGTEETAYRGILEWIENAEEEDGLEAGEDLSLALRVETLH